MTLLVLGLIVGGILILIGLSVPRAMPEMAARKGAEVRQVRRLLPTLGVLVILAGFLFASFRVVPGGHVGIQILFGRIDDRVLNEGLNVINPFKQVQILSARTQELFEHADVPSKEGLTVGLEVSVLYHLDPRWAPAVFRTLGDGYPTTARVDAKGEGTTTQLVLALHPCSSLVHA